MKSAGTMQDNDYDSMEQTATCCLGDVFFRKRRLTSASDYYKPKLALDDDLNNDDDTSGKLASSTERTVAAAGPGVNLNTKYGQTSSDDNSRGTRLDNDSYSRAVSHPVLGSRQDLLQDSSDLPPRYTPTRDDQPLPVQATPVQAAPVPRGRSKHRPRAVSAGRLAKEHEMLQNMWLESHGHRQQDGGDRAAQQRVCRRSSSLGNSRTVYIKDRATGTCYRRGRLLGKVRYKLTPQLSFTLCSDT